MQVIALRTLRRFWWRHPQADGPMRAWYAVVSRTEWSGPPDVKRQFGTTVYFVGDNRIVFDIGGNKYRPIVHVAYSFRRVIVKFIGTHAEHDKIDAETVR